MADYSELVEMLKIESLFNLKRKVPEKLYHYCKVETFYSIVESSTLRISNGHLLNDFKEKTYFYELCDEWIKEKYGGLTKPQQTAIDLFKNMPHHYFYCICFCEDGDLLSQWRDYAHDGQGVSIGFDLNEIGFQYGLPYIKPGKESFKVLQVEYDEKKQRIIVDKLLTYIIDNADKMFNVEYLANLIDAFACSFKHPGFHEEREWRVVCSATFGDNGRHIVVYGGIPNINIMAKDNKLISYFDYKLDAGFTKQMVPQIYLGPKSTIDKLNLRIFLDQYNLYGVSISKSTVPYR